MWHCHSFKPFWQLYHWIIVVPQFRLRTTAFKTHTTLQDTYNIARPSQKQSRENCRQVELQNHDNWKTVATESNESTWVQLQTSYKWQQWHQLQSSEMNITWTDIKMERRIQNCFNWQNLQTYEQLLQYVWTASARQLNGFWKQTG